MALCAADPGALPRLPAEVHAADQAQVTGDIFRTQSLGTAFNLIGVATGQRIQLLSILTEAVHTPFLADRLLAIQDARRVFDAARPLRDSLQPVPGGPLEQRAQAVLEQAVALLRRVAGAGMFEAVEHGWFADTPRRRDGGRGLEGVAVREPEYVNPFLELWEPTLAEAARG